MENDFYLCENRKDFKDDVELYMYLADKFKLEVTPVKNSYTTFCLNFLTYISHYLTLSEISVLFGAALGKPRIRSRFSQLVSSKQMGSAMFQERDGSNRVAYYLTKSGGDLVLSKLPDALRVPLKVRRSGGKVPMHDYGIGISMLQFILSPYSFIYQKEYSISSGYIKEKGSLCVDAYLSVKKPFPCTFCIEQDMGTESASILVAKLYDYHSKGLTSSPSTYLLYSCHAVEPLSECPSFHSGNLVRIKESMKRAGIDDLYQYYISGSSLDAHLLVTLETLLLRTCVCHAYDESGSMVSVDRYREGLRYKAVKGKTFTLQDLERYIEELETLCNPYRVKEYNKKQCATARRTFRSMLTVLRKIMVMEKYSEAPLSVLFKGFSCNVVPSVLLSNYLKYITPTAYHMDKVYKETLSAYYPGMGEYSIVSSPIYTGEDNPTLVMRNCFSYADGMVCVEDISHDVGAFLRCQFLLKSKPKHLKSLSIVALCDNIYDAYYFCEQTGYTNAVTHMEHEGVSLYFLPASFLGSENALKGVSMLSGVPESFSIRIEKPKPRFTITDLAALMPGGFDE